MSPGWERVRVAAVEAALDPRTWVPVGAAAALQIGDADKELSDWAARTHPVFGSEDGARQASDILWGSTAAAYFVTAMAMPTAEEKSNWPAVCATLASRNVELLPLSEGARTLVQVGFTALSAGTAWARVEGRRHFASDVLVGAALGHFLAAFFNDAFLGLDEARGLDVGVGYHGEDVRVGVRWIF